MTWSMWCSVISNLGATDQACMLEQLLCAGKLPLTCERCGHLLDQHQLEGEEGEEGQLIRTFCNVPNWDPAGRTCWDRHGHSLCPAYVGYYVEH